MPSRCRSGILQSTKTENSALYFPKRNVFAAGPPIPTLFQLDSSFCPPDPLATGSETQGPSVPVHDRPGNLHALPAVLGSRNDRDISGRAIGTPEILTGPVRLDLNLGTHGKPLPAGSFVERGGNDESTVTNAASDFFQGYSPLVSFDSVRETYKNNAKRQVWETIVITY